MVKQNASKRVLRSRATKKTIHDIEHFKNCFVKLTKLSPEKSPLKELKVSLTRCPIKSKSKSSAHIPIYRKTRESVYKRTTETVHDPYELDIPIIPGESKLRKKRKYVRKKKEDTVSSKKKTNNKIVKKARSIKRKEKDEGQKTNLLAKRVQIVINPTNRTIFTSFSKKQPEKTSIENKCIENDDFENDHNLDYYSHIDEDEVAVNLPEPANTFSPSAVITSIINLKLDKESSLKTSAYNNKIQTNIRLKRGGKENNLSNLKTNRGNKNIIKNIERIPLRPAISTPNKKSERNQHLSINKSNDLFGFEEDIAELPETDMSSIVPETPNLPPSNKIRILSNVLITPARSHPMTNRTASLIRSSIANTSDDASPWRLNFSAVKKNITERRKGPRPEETILYAKESTTSNIESTPKKKIEGYKRQTNLKNFITHSLPKTPEKLPNNNVSLFGDFYESYNLSPIKSKEKENTPKSNKKKQSSLVANVENYFGFDSNNESDGLSKIARSTPLKELDVNVNLPMRLNRVKTRRLTNMVKDNQNENQQVEDKTENILIEKEQEEEVSLPPAEENNTSGKFVLFDDPEITFTDPTKRSYRCKHRPRKKQLATYFSESEEEEPSENPVKKKHKKKSAKDIAQEEEYNRWAEQFNSLCEEIEKHELIIE